MAFIWKNIDFKQTFLDFNICKLKLDFHKKINFLTLKLKTQGNKSETFNCYKPLLKKNSINSFVLLSKLIFQGTLWMPPSGRKVT